MSDNGIVVETPDYSYGIVDHGTKVIVSAKARKAGNAAMQLSILFLALAWVPWALSLLGFFLTDAGTEGRSISLWTFTISTALIAIVIWNFRRKEVQNAAFDGEGVTTRGKKYLYENIVRIGYGNSEAMGFIGTSGQVAGYFAGRKMAGADVWIQHGNKYITLLRGLPREDAESLVDQLLARMTELRNEVP